MVVKKSTEMAGCYHDQEEFESDLTIEVAREDDILEEGQGLDEIECDKNPGHRNFIPFKDLTLEHLPKEHRDIKTFDDIKKMGSRVVRLEVGGKPGSGCVVKYDNEYHIQTANHIVKTEDEVKDCTVEFHYDDESRSSVINSTGIKLGLTCPYRDVTLFTFHPIPDFLHQLDWIDMDQFHPDHDVLQTLNTRQEGTDHMCCIGHPHGRIKTVTFGQWLGTSLEKFDTQYRLMRHHNPDCQCKEVSCVKYTCPTCPGSGGSPVFLLRKVMGQRIRFGHFMGERVNRVLVINGEQIKNINTAWFPSTQKI